MACLLSMALIEPESSSLSYLKISCASRQPALEIVFILKPICSYIWINMANRLAKLSLAPFSSNSKRVMVARIGPSKAG